MEGEREEHNGSHLNWLMCEETQTVETIVFP